MNQIIEQELLQEIPNGINMTLNQLWELSILYDIEVIFSNGKPYLLIGYKEVRE